MSLEWKRGMHKTEEPFERAASFAHALGRAPCSPRGCRRARCSTSTCRTEPPPHGYRWTKLGKRLYRDQVDERADLRGRRYYWIGGPANGYGDVPGSDCHAVRDGVVSVTPLDLDLTHAGLLERLPEWNVEGFDAVVEEEVKSA